MAAVLHTSHGSKDRRATLLLVASLVTMIGLIAFAFIAGPKILSSASTTKAIRDANEVNGCRAGFRAEVDDASSDLQTARARLDVYTSEGLAASVGNDDVGLLAAVRGSMQARGDVRRTAAELERVTARYAELVALSRTDPEQFIDRCRQETPL